MSAKKGFKIGEVCKLLDIQPYVLRYWETEFVALHPAKSQSGQRVYAEAEVAVIRRIKELLYDEGYTIAGAKKQLESREVEVGHEGKVAGERPGLFDLDRDHADGSNGAEGEPSAAQQAAGGNGKSAVALDTASPERIETFLRGVEEALAEARAALAVLERHPR